jgi:homoserine kinase
MNKRVTVEAPASSANLGAGFDVFALALKKPKDRLTLVREAGGIRVSVRGASLPESPERNIVGAVARAIMKEQGVGAGVSLLLGKGVPVGVGLGSSAASSVAAAVGIDSLFDLRLSRRKLTEYAGLGEKLASGACHYDNVAASLVGGFVMVTGSRNITSMEAPRSLLLCLVTPRVELPKEKTKYARTLLPKEVPLGSMVAAVRAAGMMVHGFASGNIEEVGAAMAGSLVDERRAAMVPGFEHVRKAAVERGAAGVCISGAGPTILAAVRSGRARRVLAAMVKAFSKEGVESHGFITGVGGGCRIVERT